MYHSCNTLKIGNILRYHFFVLHSLCITQCNTYII
ncbi:hypothetical protein Leryth_021013, partial [Lithospermum erythrorhizon]